VKIADIHDCRFLKRADTEIFVFWVDTEVDPYSCCKFEAPSKLSIFISTHTCSHLQTKRKICGYLCIRIENAWIYIKKLHLTLDSPSRLSVWHWSSHSCARCRKDGTQKLSGFSECIAMPSFKRRAFTEKRSVGIALRIIRLRPI